MKAAADCNTTKACFPVAMKYCAVVGITSREISDDFWSQMCIREGRNLHDMDQSSHRRLKISPHILVLRLHRGTLLRCRDYR